MKILLDTNAYVAWKRRDCGLLDLVRRSGRIFLSSIVAGELLYGFRNGERLAQNLKELQEFLDSPFVELVPVALTTAHRYSRIAAQLRRSGTPIPTNDIWIAAHAMETGADLVSFDKHFGRVEGLIWIDPST